MIKGVDIYKSYGDLRVLRGVDIDVSPGEIVSIVGKSGSGKSTLMHILGSLDTYDKGQVMVDGTDMSSLTKKDIAQFRNEKIGFIFQFHHLLNEFTALENVCIPAFISGMNKSDAYAKAKKLLGYLKLSERIDHKPNQLSGGEQQRVAVARSLINNPGIVFADEPSGNLDTQSSEELHNLFLELRKDLGQTFLIVTHNQDLAALSDRSLTMEDGVLIS